jgi:hypothetical protein
VVNRKHVEASTAYTLQLLRQIKALKEELVMYDRLNNKRLLLGLTYEDPTSAQVCAIKELGKRPQSSGQLVS